MPSHRSRISGGDRSGGRDRPNSKGSATRKILLETAERLFAEHGIATVPLRDVAVAAGQRNNTAVQYYFGDRESLLREITSYRAEASEASRAEALAGLLAGDGMSCVHDLVRSFVRSLARHVTDGNHYLAFLSRYIVEYGGYIGLEGAVSPTTIETFRGLLYELLPSFERLVLDERWMVLMTTTVHTLSRYQTAMRAGTQPLPFPELVDDLVEFLAGGLQAPCRQAAAPAERCD
ncbi:TetR/AcrR family transcriptional regulator [Frankia sp. CNm7]|uniref:TetR/AcrR family transcriptional regulator n=1 Tax=Frankia nepalensis TaxID=1836974 RepID=A0A937UPJ4_9ACTN|nr:TetR/AcrR family transcriptional regulator [Frankia nepalensis]MBL7502698.1 TetR/AcrR family transcriptional regulator [Frankia nepalensis]MBL7515853.1 TetR/AcrR family transcriptional regulator [Frankia nepalensis]MBL7521435.1 TetR/AcrR family transcriptional regulator [Frankia nepalensis]MBL7629143.1 TetR/AcrR family transcriptional regulator [Frankia nepalensis]